MFKYMNISWLSRQLEEVEEDSTTVDFTSDELDIRCSDLALTSIVKCWENPYAMEN